MKSDIRCTIPAGMLRYTVSALDELAIRQRMQAEKPGVAAPVAAELLEQAVAVKNASDFYHELYNQWIRDPDSCSSWSPDSSSKEAAQA